MRSLFPMPPAQLRACYTNHKMPSNDYFPSHDKRPSLEPRKPDPQAFLLSEIAHLECFTSDRGQAYVSLPARNGASHHVPITSSRFRHHLTHIYYEEYGEPLPDALRRRLVRMLEARAHCAGASLPIDYRVAIRGTGFDGQVHFPSAIALHLGGASNQIVEITPDYWTLNDGPFYCFRLTRNAAPLPEPVRAPAHRRPLAELRTLLRVRSQRHWTRCLLWLLSAFCPHGPYPVLLIRGPAHSGKTLAARFLRSLIDPVLAPFAPHTASERRLLDYARDNLVLAFDDIGQPRPAFLRILKRISGGMIDELREPRSDAGPAPVNIARPVILTQDSADPIPESLAERTLLIELDDDPASEDPEPVVSADDLYTELAELRPLVVGALCEALQTLLAKLPTQHQPDAARLPELARWSLAAAPALDLDEDGILYALRPEPHPAAQALIEFMQSRHSWRGIATDLRDALPGPIPTSANHFARWLRQSEPDLAREGLSLSFSRQGKSGARLIHITSEADDPELCSKPPGTDHRISEPPGTDTRVPSEARGRRCLSHTAPVPEPHGPACLSHTAPIPDAPTHCGSPQTTPETNPPNSAPDRQPRNRGSASLLQFH